MDSEQLLETAQSNGPIDSTDDARDAVDATMETLGERITDGQANDLAGTLPDVAAEPLRDPHPGEAAEFSTAAFVDRVAGRADLADEAVPATRAALTAVREAGDDAEIERTRDQLPDDFDLLFEPGRPMDDSEFEERVETHLPDDADVDPRAITNATLETLGDRIAGGQAGDLAIYLPRGVRSPLTDTDEDAIELDREEFLEHVSSRAEIDEDDALDAARAVVQAIRETAAETEVENVTTQLPADFDPLFDEGSG